MTFVRNLFQGGENYHIAVGPFSAILQPMDDSTEALDAFQAVVADVCAHEGQGYSVQLASTDPDSPFIDSVIVFLDLE